MAGKHLHRWVFSWLCRWFPGHAGTRRRPVARTVRPMLMLLEERSSPTSFGGMLPAGSLAPPPHNPQINGTMPTALADSWQTSDATGPSLAETLAALSSAQPQYESSPSSRAFGQTQPSQLAASFAEQQAAAAEQVFLQLAASLPASPLSKPPAPTPPPANTGSGGGGVGGASTPNAGGGGGGPTGGGGGPGLQLPSQTQLQQMLSGAGSSTPSTHPTPPTPPANGQTPSPLSPFQSPYAFAAPTPNAAVPPWISMANQMHGHAPSADPLYVLDLNTGETVPSGVPLNTFSTWSENLLAQVSGATVSSYSWNLSQAPDFTATSGTTGPSLQGTWASFTGAARTNTISVTETPVSGSPLTQTMTFQVAGTDSPAYTSTRPTSSSTWASVVTPDQLTSGQPTQAAGPYASVGLVDGTVQTTFAMPSYNPNTTPVSLDYNSTTANPQPIFLTEYQLPVGQSVPSTITAQLTFNNTAMASVTYNTSALNPGDIVQIALQANANGLNTGRYPWSITVTNGGTPTTYSGSVDIVNRANSPYGAGWSLDNVEQLVSVSGGMMLVNPDGTSLYFASNGSGGYITPAGDFSTLTLSNGVYTRTLTDGTQINFNSSGQETSTVDRDGNTTTFGYTNGLLTSITDMNGQVTTLSYTNGQLTSITDPASRTASLSYTGSQLTGIIDVGGNLWTYGYDVSNDLTSLTDPNTHATSFTYNFADRVSSVTQPDNSTESLIAEQMNGLAAPGTGTSANPAPAVLLATGDQAQFTDGNNNVWTTNLDWLGFGLDVQDGNPLGNTTLTYINTNGLAWMSANALGQANYSFFDNRGNTTETVNPDNSTQLDTYNSFGEVLTSTNELGAVTTDTYNNKGDLTQVTDALGNSTTYAYNGAGLVTSTTDANGHTTTNNYNALNELTSTTDAMNNTTTYAYNNAGQVDSETNALGYITTYSFNAMNWMTGKTVPVSSGVNATYTYGFDKVGNQTSVTSPITATQNATSTSKFDAMNRLLKSIDPLGDATSYYYDGAGNNTGIVDPMGNATVYTFNAAGEQIGVSVPLTGSGSNTVFSTTTYTYNAAGYKITKTDALGNTWTYTYTNRGQLSTVTDPLGNQTSYGYDLAGQQTSVTQMVLQNGTYVPGQTTTTNYNSIGQVTQTTSPYNGANQGVFSGNNAGGGTGTYTATLGGSVTGTFAGTVTGNILNANNQPIATFTGTVSGILNGNLSSSYVLSGGFSGTGTIYTTGGITGTATFSFASGLSGYLNPGSGSLTCNLQLGVNGSVNTSGNASGTIGGSVSVQFTGTSSGGETSIPNNPFTGTAAPTTTSSYDAVGNVLTQTGPGGTTTFGYNANNMVTSTTDGMGDTTTYGYDALGNRISSTNALNQTTTYTFNRQGWVLTQTNPDGGVTTYNYDLAGDQISITDPNGNVTSSSYNAANQLIGVTDALGATTTYAYDKNGNRIGVTNALGYTTSYAYNDANELIAVTDAMGYTTNYNYNLVGEQTSVTDPLGNVTSYTYNGVGNKLTVTTANGGVTSYAYDSFGNVKSITDPNGNTTNYSYNSNNELVKTTDALGNTTSYSYDNFGNQTSITDANGNTTTYTYNARNQVSTVTNALNQTTTYGYNAVGEQTSVTDALNHVTATTYNAEGLVLTATAPNGSVTTYKYDLGGNLLSITDPVGNITSYSYNADNELVKTTNPLGYATTDAYNAVGQLTGTTDALGRTITNQYNKDGNLLTQTDYNANGTVQDTKSFTYDANGNVLTATNGYGTYTYTYDKNNNILTQTDPFGLKLTYGYDANNNVTSITDSLGGSTTKVYNSDIQLTSIQYTNGTSQARLDLTYTNIGQVATMKRYRDTAGSQLISQTAYSYDGAGNTTAILHTNASGATIGNYVYSYDNANRLSSETVTENGGSPVTTTYGYDAASQLTSVNGTSYTYDANGNRTTSGFSTGTGNELLSDGTWNYKYDAAGNTILKTNISSGEYWTYTWNDANQLTVAADYQSNGTLIQSVTFQYDVFGNRVEEDVYNASTQVTTVTKFAYNANGNIWADLNASNQLVDRRLFVNVNGQTQPFARIDASNNLSWYLTDNLGSIRLITDNTGTVIDQIDYDAWGNITNETNPSNGDRYKYAGGQYDTTLGMSLHAQNSTGRWYNASNGNWLNADPTGLAAGPNPYDYVGNNPTNANDSTGLAQRQLGLAETISISGGKAPTRKAFVNDVGSVVDDKLKIDGQIRIRLGATAEGFDPKGRVVWRRVNGISISYSGTRSRDVSFVQFVTQTAIVTRYVGKKRLQSDPYSTGWIELVPVREETEMPALRGKIISSTPGEEHIYVDSRHADDPRYNNRTGAWSYPDERTVSIFDRPGGCRVVAQNLSKRYSGDGIESITVEDHFTTTLAVDGKAFYFVKWQASASYRYENNDSGQKGLSPVEFKVNSMMPVSNLNREGRKYYEKYIRALNSSYSRQTALLGLAD